MTDTQTRLMWTKNANLFGVMTWAEAQSRCGSYSISDIGGWRLPSKDEITGLYNAGSDGHPFTEVQPSFYWSGTRTAGDNGRAWSIHMGYGHTNLVSRSNTFHVWPVRASQ